ncbi:LSU ribosomal protein L33P [Mycoplasma testudineum]|uniref:Large ribosomal subunit protein bL33 n=1 Tax=Mycoplasma testudineum TaxID=244584 RepID=A0A4R6ID06_9MOLU|nr:50S ribosomal protein L33 [Mycoplasma testudineum]OYD26575.1 50S ribosomal protein L33 [Mycoplasma testudineum]TDO19408.1 LSU ribosomal protein L33P [Mycoplasma testudineum]
MKAKIALACQECKRKNYKTNKSKPERLEINKFCSNCRAKTMHKEEK